MPEKPKYLTDWRGAGLKSKELCELHLRNKLLARRHIKRRKEREQKELKDDRD